MNNCTIRELNGPEELQACIDLQRDTWGSAFGELVPTPVLKIAQRTGGVAAGAFDESGELAGFVFGITGVEDRELVHWSDMLAVREHYRNRGIGEQLKRYQREVLLERGVKRMYWTFDPLEAKNAYINFARLGVIAREYVRDMYGSSNSVLHKGIGTDRLVALWDLGSRHVADRLAGISPASQEIMQLPEINTLRADDDLLVTGRPNLGLAEDRMILHIPSQIQQIKNRSRETAAEWRSTTRAALEYYLGRSYEVVDLVRGEAHSSYVLARLT